MKVLLVLWLVLSSAGAMAQPGLSQDQEKFADTIAGLVIGREKPFFLIDQAPPCSFQRYNYDDWFRFGLILPVPIDMLNALSRKAYLDQGPRTWQPGVLHRATCITEQAAAVLLKKATCQVPGKHISRAGRRGIVYFISRPEFTDDGQYAVIDIGFRCDGRQGGTGATYLFRKYKGSWQLAGKKTAWVN